jgi:hypothetical protein
MGHRDLRPLHRNPDFTMLCRHLQLNRDKLSSMDDRTIDGQPRTSRRYTPYDTCPLPTIADKRLFILT